MSAVSEQTAARTVGTGKTLDRYKVHKRIEERGEGLGDSCLRAMNVIRLLCSHTGVHGINGA